MRGFHFSLRWLFGVVSFLAIGCGLLIYAKPLLSKLTFTAALVVLLAATFAAIYRVGDQRVLGGVRDLWFRLSVADLRQLAVAGWQSRS